MANWSNPTLTSLYTDFVTEVKNRDVDLALGLDPATTSPTNVPTGSIRWNSASFKYQKWDGSTWNDLSTKYIFTAVEVSGATVPVNGMYLSTTNTLNFSTASTASRLTIDASGNVNIDSGTFYVDAVGNRTGVNNTSPGSYNAAADDLVVGLTGDTGVTIASTNQGSIFFADGTTGGAQQAAGYLYYLHSNDSMGFGTANTLRMTLDASGNLGLGVVPSAWNTLTAFQLPGGSISTFSTYQNFLSSNAYYAGSWKYVSATTAGQYLQDGNIHKWYISTNTPSAGGAITFTQAMTLDASGNLGVGSTSISPAYGYSRVIEVAGGFPGIKFAPSGASTFGFQIGAGTGGFQFYDVAAATERARIDSSGYMQGTVNGLGAGRIPAKQYYRLDSARNGVNQAAAQSVFGVGVTLVGSTVYEFEALYWLQCSSASGSPTMNFLFGGTATLNNIMYSGVGPGSTSVLPPASFYDAAPTSFITNVATASTVSGTLTSAISVVYLIKGTVSVNAGGTFIPQYSFDVAPGNLFTTNAGSYFSIWPLAASGAAVNIGSWA